MLSPLRGEDDSNHPFVQSDRAAVAGDSRYDAAPSLAPRAAMGRGGRLLSRPFTLLGFATP